MVHNVTTGRTVERAVLPKNRSKKLWAFCGDLVGFLGVYVMVSVGRVGKRKVLIQLPLLTLSSLGFPYEKTRSCDSGSANLGSNPRGVAKLESITYLKKHSIDNLKLWAFWGDPTGQCGELCGNFSHPRRSQGVFKYLE
jgi:hypothetical protein